MLFALGSIATVSAKERADFPIELPFPQRDLNIRSPQLNTALATWTQQKTGEISVLDQPEEPPIDRLTAKDLLAGVKDYSCLLQDHEQLEDSLIKQLVKQMRSNVGLEIKDRRFRLTVYPDCFVGSEAVTWLAKTQNATREAAVRIGHALVEKGFFHHVTDEHPFKDKYLFYRFYEDEG